MHISVLKEEAIEYLNLKDTSTVVDATVGFSGHSQEILKKIKKGFLFALDQDETAIDYSKKLLQTIGDNYKIIKTNFKDIKKHVKQADAILYDLGVSSVQLDEKTRGFSFHQDNVLDMRMDLNNSLTAKEIVNSYSYARLVKIIKEYGEEKYASSIASAIIKYREKKEINSTLELVDIISSAVPFKYKKDHHPARKTFQAIRIEVNDELNVFEASLKDALDILNINGRICVITFHSLEDRLCQSIFKSVSQTDVNLKNMPFIPEDKLPKYKIIAKVKPSKKEVEENPRSRSATLRVIERVR